MKKLAALILFALCFLAGLAPAEAQQVTMQGPVPGMDTRLCLDCHRLPNLNTTEGVYSNQAFCLECHGQKVCTKKVGEEKVSLFVDMNKFKGSRHQYVACQSCHNDVARSPHVSQTGVQCLSCHSVHGESLVNDPHLRVRCEACHHQGGVAKVDPATGLVGLASLDAKGQAMSLADHSRPDLQSTELCLKCHVRHNQAGAPAYVLPAKSVLCFLCHPASFSLGNFWFAAALVIFLGGLVILFLFWLKGKVEGESQSAHKKIALGAEKFWRTMTSPERNKVLKVILLDVLLQRRILQESVQRWFFHTLLYWSILSRLILGLFTWFVYQAWPDSSLALGLMDKNNAFVAIFNDLTGLCLLVGVVLAALQRYVLKPRHVASEYKDNVALALLGAMAILGFLVEAARLTMSQIPPDLAVHSFVAYPLSRVFALLNWEWTLIYVWLWYAHGLVAAAFVAYLPFGKMKHMFVSPLSLVLNRDLE
ncbi:MAG: respiratory nitrate reductase subunit gamma [Deltaproteobacteria bacterium]|nr:respiratory nitrate reductase subunit gamma [Deltaproteobacteria bacterium]